jgi:hypothetical protein
MPHRKYNTEEERKEAKLVAQKKYRLAHLEECAARVSAAKRKRWENDAEYRAQRLNQMKEYNAKKTLEKQREKYEMLKLKFEAPTLAASIAVV